MFEVLKDVYGSDPGFALVIYTRASLYGCVVCMILYLFSDRK